jgi:uncharacterized protein YegP (UPF0339 family)
MIINITGGFDNGETVCSSEGYSSKQNAMNSAELIKYNAMHTKIDDRT